MVLTMLATTAIAQTQTIHTLKMTDGTVNQNYNTDALIDMQSTSKGLLLPRVELTGTTAAAPLAAHTAGMVVYNTVSAGSGGTAVSPGYYYNDGTQWVANWIGTNDVADFVTKTNGAERLRVTSGGKLLVGTSSSLTGGANAIMQINNGTTNGALQIVDGTQGAGKVLTSDANGLATWTDGSGIAWTLKGNTGITANNAAYGSSLTAGTGNWLGTINSADLILAANNKEGLRVNSSQQVLIGTTTVPTGGTTAKVIIDNATTNGALQIKDGTQGDGKVLTSDVNGVARWTTSSAKIILGNKNTTNVTGLTAGDSFYTNNSITFNEPGSYFLYYSLDVHNDGDATQTPTLYLYLHSSTSKATTGFTTIAGLAYGWGIRGGSTTGIGAQSIITINEAPITLYLFASLTTSSWWVYNGACGKMTGMYATKVNI
ncbi:MAG: hypothetical protein H6Q20_340 [Bacteroidetes bacterium]|nr:hypothetical protein [Bacteroidota bacterium]